MLPGHTKFRPDSYFGLFKKYYRRQDHVDDMDDLADCVRQCGQDVTCVPQLYQDWHYYDWNAFLGQWFTPLAGLGRYYTFRFDPQTPWCHENEDLAIGRKPHRGDHAEGWSGHKGHKGCLSEPSDATCYYTQWIVPDAVYERVREYVCDPQKRDKVCPKPPPGTGPNSGNASSLPESDQPGPSTAIQDRVESISKRVHSMVDTVHCKE